MNRLISQPRYDVLVTHIFLLLRLFHFHHYYLCGAAKPQKAGKTGPYTTARNTGRMDSLARCRSVNDTRVSLFSPPASVVSHLSSMSLHSIALTPTGFRFAFVRNPPVVLISSKFSGRISCEAIATKQSHLNPQREEGRQRRHKAMNDFLLQECCFSSSEITILVSKDGSLFRRKSTDRANQVLQVFKNCGFTIAQVRKTILRNPNILSRSTIHLNRRIEYLKSLGLAEEDVNYIVSDSPRILNDSLNGTLAPKILLLIKIFGSKDNLFKVLRRAPAILSCDVELVNNKLRALENAGLQEHEIEQILEKDPRFLCSSVGKIEKNMKFLTCTLGLKPNVLVKYPILVNLSVEKRLRPRVKVFQYVNSLQARPDTRMGLITSLIVSEEYFTENFLSGSPELKKLYEKYKGKTVDVEEPELLTTQQR